MQNLRSSVASRFVTLPFVETNRANCKHMYHILFHWTHSYMKKIKKWGFQVYSLPAAESYSSLEYLPKTSKVDCNMEGGQHGEAKKYPAFEATCVAICNLGVAICNLGVTICKLGVAVCNLGVVSPRCYNSK